MHVEIDPERCSGHARCHALAPSVFTLDEQGYGVVLRPEVAADDLDDVRRAERNCPERAILLRAPV